MRTGAPCLPPLAPLHCLGDTFGCASGWGWQLVPISPLPPGQLLVLPLASSSTALQGRLALPVFLTGEEKSGVCLCRSPLLPPRLTPQVAVFHRNVRLGSSLPHSSWVFFPSNLGLHLQLIFCLLPFSPETLMDTKWVTSELAWTTHPETGVSLEPALVLTSKGQGWPWLRSHENRGQSWPRPHGNHGCSPVPL